MVLDVEYVEAKLCPGLTVALVERTRLAKTELPYLFKYGCTLLSPRAREKSQEFEEIMGL